MKSLIQQARYFRLTGHKVVIALAVASAISALSISPALAENDDDQDQGDWHGDHGRREWRDDREGYYVYRPEYRHPYIYAQPVYVPPPVYYEPRPSPGISIFFPLDLR